MYKLAVGLLLSFESAKYQLGLKVLFGNMATTEKDECSSVTGKQNA